MSDTESSRVDLPIEQLLQHDAYSIGPHQWDQAKREIESLQRDHEALVAAVREIEGWLKDQSDEISSDIGAYHQEGGEYVSSMFAKESQLLSGIGNVLALTAYEQSKANGEVTG